MAAYSSFQKPLWRLKPRERKVILFLGDVLAVSLGLTLALFLWASSNKEYLRFSLNFLTERVPFWFYLLPVAWLLMMMELYDVTRAANRKQTVRDLTVIALVSLMIYLAVYFTSSPDSLPRLGVAIFVIASYLFTLLWRLIYIAVFTSPSFMRRVLIIGAGRSGTRLVEIFKGLWPPPFYLVGLIDDSPDKQGQSVEGFPILGGAADLMGIIKEHHVTDLVFAISGEMNPKMFATLLEAAESGIQVTTMPTVYEELLGRVPIFLLESDWVLRSFVDQTNMGGLAEFSSRMLDVVGSLIGLCILVVVTPFIGILTLIDSGWPIFYGQERLGKNGRPYQILKFRSMRQDAEKDGVARPASEHDDRVTHVGRFLRKSHLDELPQFINVLRGEMSLVGPRSERPELVQILQEKIPFYRARLFVRPGLTGWAQVNYGYASNAEQNAVKLEYDLYYIKHRSLWLDLSILLRTVGSVVGLKGR